MRQLTILLACTFLIGLSSVASAELRAGAATSNITPDLGGNIVGGFAPFPATHIHDDLHVRCLVLEEGDTRVALVVCDLLGISRLLSDEARQRIEEQTGIPIDNILISATHTHSGCNARSSEDKLDDYQQFIVRRISDAVRCAANRLRPAEIGWTTAQAPEHVFNRRWFLKPGTMPPNPFGQIDQVKMNPPSGSDSLAEPAGPTDPTVTVLSLREPDGKPLALYSVYSLHYVGGVGPGHISADYYGMYCAEVERLLGAERQDPPFVAMMANGTSGDVNNISFRTPRPGKAPYEQMRAVAHDVAAKVHAALQSVEYRDTVPLGVTLRQLTLQARRPTEEQLAWARKTVDSTPAEPGKVDLSRIYAERTLRLADAPDTVVATVQAFRIGDLVLGTMPCEVFCEIGLEFRQRAPSQPAALISLAHGYEGYLPTPRHFALGGYETWLGTNRLEPEASVKLLDTLDELTGVLSK